MRRTFQTRPALLLLSLATTALATTAADGAASAALFVTPSLALQAAAGAAHIVAIADSRLSSTTEMAVPAEAPSAHCVVSLVSCRLISHQVPAEARFGTTSQQDYDHAMCDSCEREDGPEGGALLFCDWCAEPRARATSEQAPLR